MQFAQTSYTSAQDVPATDAVPAHCRVELTVAPAIRVAIALPHEWNGRFQGVGGGGWAGSLSNLDGALADGFAAGTTDTGHSASAGGRFVRNPDGSFNAGLAEDFASRSLHEMTVRGQELTGAFYGQEPSYSYWNGCSTGGRQGLMEAQRFPDDYDGIMAGAPAINWDRFIPAEIWPQLVMHQSGNLVTICDLEAATTAATAACDDLDGVVDGVIGDPRLCDYDPAELAGTVLDCGDVFTAADAEVVRKIWDGPRSADGSFLWYGLTPSTSLTALANPNGPFPISNEWIQYWVEQNPDWDYRTATYAEFEQIFKDSRRYNDLIGTDDPDLSAFRDSGGKVLIWHGWADNLIFPEGTIDYYERIADAMGKGQAQHVARLFMAPGVSHCRGGAGPDTVNFLGALMEWVEHGRPPRQLRAAKVVDDEVVQTRPLCLYPKVARYLGHGSTDDAENFSCQRTF